MKITKISKGYSRKISIDYQVWVFATELEAEVSTEENIDQVSNELFNKARQLVGQDIKKCLGDKLKIVSSDPNQNQNQNS